MSSTATTGTKKPASKGKDAVPVVAAAAAPAKPKAAAPVVLDQAGIDAHIQQLALKKAKQDAAAAEARAAKKIADQKMYDQQRADAKGPSKKHTKAAPEDKKAAKKK